MDDSWGNILYLIAAVVFGIVSLLKKKKPPVAVNPLEEDEVILEESPEERISIESALEALLGGKLHKPIVEIEEEPEPVHQESMMEEYHRKEKEKAEERRKTTATTFSPTDSIVKNAVLEIEEEEEDLEEIDWRKAIIYKEILDRKYN